MGLIDATAGSDLVLCWLPHIADGFCDFETSPDIDMSRCPTTEQE